MKLSDFGLVPCNYKAVTAGAVYGRLTILAIGRPNGSYRYKAVCRCECGTITAIRLDGITSGAVVSCGCYHKQVTTKHGLTKHPLYPVWRHMMARCCDQRTKSFKNYGARGITVCERWHNVENFVADMAPTYASGLEIDRIDNNGNYEPGNCRWATLSENADNRRTGVYLTFNGKTQSLRRWAQETGINYATLHERIHIWKWDTERALTTPALSKEERMAIARAVRWGTKSPSP